jgi:hypothetical protein
MLPLCSESSMVPSVPVVMLPLRLRDASGQQLSVNANPCVFADMDCSVVVPSADIDTLELIAIKTKIAKTPDGTRSLFVIKFQLRIIIFFLVENRFHRRCYAMKKIWNHVFYGSLAELKFTLLMKYLQALKNHTLY